MIKKLSVILMSAVLLSACGQGDEGESSSEETSASEETTSQAASQESSSEEESSEEETSQADTADSGEHVFDGLITEETFTNETGYAAWEHYKAMEEFINLGDGTTFAEETADLSTIEGTSTQEISDHYFTLEGTESVTEEVVGITEAESFQTFMYPPEEGSEYEEEAMFFAQNFYMSAYDNTYYMVIAPGYYEVEPSRAIPTEEALTATTVSDLEALNPQVLSVSQMNIGGTPINQVMFTTVREDGSMDAMYFFVQGEEIIYQISSPFEEASVDFPIYGLLAFSEVLPTMIEDIE